jgi:hypothetical protein
MADVDGKLQDFLFFGKFGYAANYEYIKFRNEAILDTRHDANTNQLALTLTSKPSDAASIKFTQRTEIRDDIELDLYADRRDVTFLTVQVRPGEAFNTLTNYEYKRYTVPGNDLQLWQDNPLQSVWAGNFALEYIPIEKIKAMGKIGRRRDKDWVNDTTQTDDFLLGQISYFHTHHLSFHAESEVTKGTKHAGSLRVERERIWDLGLRVNWNQDRFHELTAGMIRRENLDGRLVTRVDAATSDTTVAYEETTPVSYIVLISGSLSLTERIFARGSYKGILLNEPVNNDKTFVKLEVGYDSHDWYRVSIGYERINNDNDLMPNWEYTGQGVFVRLTGKM